MEAKPNPYILERRSIRRIIGVVYSSLIIIVTSLFFLFPNYDLSHSYVQINGKVMILFLDSSILLFWGYSFFIDEFTNIPKIIYLCFSLLWSFGLLYCCNGYENVIDWGKGSERIKISRCILNRTVETTYSGGEDGYAEALYQIQQLLPYTFYFNSDDSLYDYTRPERPGYIHDTVDIEILKYDYEVKIAKTRKPAFSDRHFDWDRIHLRNIKYSNPHI